MSDARPVILALDDEPEVSRAVARDLRQAYGEHYRILRAESPLTAMETLTDLRLRNDAVALLLSDQRMPEMSGVEFLEQASKLFPTARRVLLTAYADTEAAIHAINRVRLDYYLMKPWHPPELNLFPVLGDLLEDWSATQKPTFRGVQLIDHRWSPLGHELREFLAGNHVPYRWLDVEHDPEAARLLELLSPEEKAACDAPKQVALPIVVLPDGTRFMRPSPTLLAEKLGITTRGMVPVYDLLIVGGGPAGLAAAVYGASEGLKSAIIEKEAPGGQAGTSSRIENYLGFPAGLSGADLSRRAVAQAKRFGADLVLTQAVTGLRVQAPYKFVQLSDGTEVGCRALVISSGVQYRRLDVARPRCIDRRGRVLRRRHHRDRGVPGTGCRDRRWRQFRRPGRHLPRELRSQRHHHRARRRARGHDVEIPHRSHRRHFEHHRPAVHAGGERDRHGSPRDRDARQRAHRGGGDRATSRRSSSSSAPSRAPIGSAIRRCATTTGSSSPVAICWWTVTGRRYGRSNAIRSCSRRACPACSRRATYATVP